MISNTTDGLGKFRQYLPDLSTPRFVAIQQEDAHEYAADFKENKNPPWFHVFAVADIAVAANEVLNALDKTQKAKTLHYIDDPRWRTWSNPEFLLSDKGIRLDEISPDLRDKVLEVLRLTLSQEGFDKATSAMRLNGLLGNFVKAKRVCNEFSYNFAIFGFPSETKPWGLSIYRHHLCLNIFLYRSQIIASPCFTGAEPNAIDIGPYAGTSILQREDRLGLQLMQSLPAAEQSKGQVYKLLKYTCMPTGRWNRDDQRHLCGTYRDNRVVPYEGITVLSMNEEQIRLVEAILEEFLLYLPSNARKARLSHIRKYYNETYLSWTGGFTDNDAFYYRLQSPIIIV